MIQPAYLNFAVWIVSAAVVGCIIVRPRRLPEAVWAALGAILLVIVGAIPWRAAASAVGEGADVYLFLIGMMMLAELARREGLFDTLAALAVHRSGGSQRRLFALVYGAGILVTVFLSNDATAIVLTPAVYAATKAAKAEPLPYLFICAFIANAASFVLPISNPANLVLFGSHMPPLAVWLGQFTLPSLLSIGVTFAVLRFTQRKTLREELPRDVAVPILRAGGWLTLCGIGATAAVLLVASAFGRDLGLPTFISGALTAAIVLLRKREAPWPVLRDISWSVLPLVAGLFVLVEGLARTGVIHGMAVALSDWAARSAAGAAFGGGLLVALVSNVMNNLPVGLIASSALRDMGPGAAGGDMAGALLIGVDLGPNLSVTGSLATILWLLALRREGQVVGFWRFLRLGALVMPPALILALGALIVTG